MTSTTALFRGLFFAAVLAAASVSYALAAPDTAKDAAMTWDQVSIVAGETFAAADPDKDGTLDAKEARKLGITRRDLTKADPDKDGTLDKAEYLAIVKQRFDAADTNHDGKLSAKELATRRGRAVLRLIQ